MLWTYARSQESLRLETRFDRDTEEYVLIFQGESGGQQHIERFKDAALFQSRLVSLEKQLERDGWHSSGAPVFLRDGWKI